MANKPFLAVHTTITDESSTTTTPSAIGTNSVLITQGQQKRIFETLTTAIQGNPMGSFGANFQQPQQVYFCHCSCAQPNNNVNFLRANAHLIPGGVVFTFGPQIYRQSLPPPCPCNYISQQCNDPFSQELTLEQKMTLNEIERHGLESLLLKERCRKNPFALEFHHNKNTSTSDLLNGPSMGQPDLEAAAAFSLNNTIHDYPMYSSDIHSKARQLNLPENHKDRQAPPDFISTCEEKDTMTGKNCDQPHVTFENENKNETQEECKKQENDKKELEKENYESYCKEILDELLAATTDDECYDTEDEEKNKK